MAPHLVASLGDEAYAAAPRLARPSTGRQQPRCTVSARRRARQAKNGRKSALGWRWSARTEVFCARCTALRFSRGLTFALSGAPPRTETEDALLIGASALQRGVRR